MKIKILAATLLTLGCLNSSFAIEQSPLELYNSFTTAASNQKTCIIQVTSLGNIRESLKFLSPQGYQNLQKYEPEGIQKLFDQLVSMYDSKNVKGGLEHQQLVNLVNALSSITAAHKTMNPNWDSELLINNSMDKCYAYFQEFSEDSDIPFEVIEEAFANVPQDFGWDFFKFDNIEMDFEGNVIRQK